MLNFEFKNPTKIIFGKGEIAKISREIPKTEKIFPCIKCGACVDACPISLNPSKLGILAKSEAYDTMAEEFHLMDCFECGSCSFVCPSNIPLVQYFRLSKGIIRKRNAEKIDDINLKLTQMDK